jgi:hypothetical protein
VRERERERERESRQERRRVEARQKKREEKRREEKRVKRRFAHDERACLALLSCRERRGETRPEKRDDGARASHERLEPFSSTSSKRENVHRAHAQASEHTISSLVSCLVSHVFSSHVTPLLASRLSSLHASPSPLSSLSTLVTRFCSLSSLAPHLFSHETTHKNMRDLMISLPRDLMISLPPSLLDDLITS